MDTYRLLTGGRQLWNMFESIPALHSLDMRIEMEDEAGGKTLVGCVLPGFQPYPKPEISRYYVLFHRLLASPSGDAFREAYLRNVASLLPAQKGSGKWSLVKDAEFIRDLFYSRRDGQISLPVVTNFAPTSPDGNAQ